MNWRILVVGLVVGALAAGFNNSVRAQAINPELPSQLTAAPGSVVRGQALALNRQTGLCVLCHQVPGGDERFQGNLAPSLAGVGKKLSEAQLRLRMMDSRAVNPESIMPAYFRSTGYFRGSNAADKTLLTAEQIEDLVAYLKTL